MSVGRFKWLFPIRENSNGVISDNFPVLTLYLQSRVFSNSKNGDVALGVKFLDAGYSRLAHMFACWVGVESAWAKASICIRVKPMIMSIPIGFFIPRMLNYNIEVVILMAVLYVRYLYQKGSEPRTQKEVSPTEIKQGTAFEIII